MLNKIILFSLVVFACGLAQQAAADTAARAPIAGQLLDPDGKPLPNTRMCLSTRQQNIWFPALPDPANGDAFCTTDSSGNFSFPAQTAPANILVFTDDGYVIAKTQSPKFSLPLSLTRWATLEATVKIGDKPAPAGIKLTAYYRNSEIGNDRIGPFPYFMATTDEHGHASFGRVLVGSYVLCRSETSTPVSIDAPAGKLAQAQIPIIGRPIKGRIILPPGVQSPGCLIQAWTVFPFRFPQLVLPANILQMSPAQRLAWYNQWETQTPQGHQLAAQRDQMKAKTRFISIRSDRTFEIDDVTAGPIRIETHFYPIVDQQADFDHRLALVNYCTTIGQLQGGPTLNPIDVGDLSPQSSETLNAGQVVPDVVFHAADGKDHLLSEYKGKIIFLDFWGTWCGSCLHDLPNVKAIHDAYANNPDFVMISLSTGDEPDVWQKFIQQNQMTWTQGILGKFDDAWQTHAMCVPGYPTYYLIDSDGKLLASGWQSEGLRPFIAKALKNQK